MLKQDAPLTPGSEELDYLNQQDDDLDITQAIEKYSALVRAGTTVHNTETDAMASASAQADSDEGKNVARSIFKTEIIQLTEWNPSAWITLSRDCA